MNPEDTSKPEEKPSDDSAYDFILETNEPDAPKEPFVGKKKIVIVSILLVLAIIIGITGYSTYIGRINADQKGKLLVIAQQQTEISRVAAIASEKSDNPDVQARAEAITTSLNESLGETQAMLEDRGSIPTDEELKAKENPSIDDQLTKAVEFNNFDKSFDKAINNQLVEYQRNLLAAQKIGNAREKASLEEFYNKSNSMLGLVDQPQNQ